MNYEVEITDTAQRDVKNIYTYIAKNLCNKQAAVSFISTLKEKISLLENMPKSYPLADDEYLKKIGIRFIVIKNYMVFYKISTEEKKVCVLRVLFGKRNWTEILKNN